MASGKIKWFSQKKGYGFIEPDIGSHDVFVHITALQESGIESVEEGMRVEFELHQRKDGKTTADKIYVIPDSDE